MKRDKFEYRVVRISKNTLKDSELESDSALATEKFVENELNKLGEDGWEVCQVFKEGKNSSVDFWAYEFFLKRKKVEEPREVF